MLFFSSWIFFWRVFAHLWMEMPLDPPVVRQSNLSDLLFSSHNDVFHMKFIYACGVPKVSLEDEKQESSSFTLSLFDHVLLHVLSLTVFVLFFFFSKSLWTLSPLLHFFLTCSFSLYVFPHMFSLTYSLWPHSSSLNSFLPYSISLCYFSFAFPFAMFCLTIFSFASFLSILFVTRLSHHGFHYRFLPHMFSHSVLLHNFFSLHFLT